MIDRSVLILVVFILSGCGIIVRADALSDMQKSKTAYKECLAKNQSDPSACEYARLTYETDVKAYMIFTGKYKAE